MIFFELYRKPTCFYIFENFIRKYGVWIFIILIFAIFLEFVHLFNWSFFLLLSLSIIIAGYGPGYNSNKKIVYKVEIDYEGKELFIYHFVLIRFKMRIPFCKLHAEFVKTKASKEELEEWRIHLSKKPWPIVGVLRSSNGIWSWEKKQMIELSKELYVIKQNHKTWKPEKFFIQEPVGKIRSFERVDYFE